MPVPIEKLLRTRNEIVIWYADFLISQRKIEEAFDVTKENPKICKEYNWIDYINLCHRSLATIYRHQDRLKEAEENVLLAIDGAKKTGTQDIETTFLIELSKIRLAQKEHKEAESIATQALRIYSRCGYRLYEVDAELTLSKVYLSQNDHTRAKIRCP